MERTKEKCYHVNKQFLPIKLSYFTLCAALASLHPFLPIALTQLGLSKSEASQIYGLIPFLSAVMRVTAGVVADKLKAHKAVLMFFCVTTGSIFFSLMFVSKLPSEKCEVTVEKMSAALCTSKEEKILLCSFDEYWRDQSADEEKKQLTSIALNCSETTSCGTIKFSVSSNVAYGQYPDCVYGIGLNGQPVCFEEILISDVMFQGTCSEITLDSAVDLTCSGSVAQMCPEQKTKYSQTFWIALSICLLGYFAFAPTTALMHALAYVMLDEDRNKWGKQRYFGTLGYLTSALAIGLMMQLTSSSEGKDSNLTANFITYFSLYVITAGFVYLYELPKDIKLGSMLTNLKTLITNPVIAALFALVFGLGINVGAKETFLLLYIKELGGTELLLGLSLFMGCIIEIPALYFADLYLGKFGYVKCLYLSCAAYALRFLSYGLIHNAWLVLLINCLNSITFGVMYCAATAYGSANTPPAMHGTMQGAIQALHYGFGRGIGSMLSGQIVEYHGIRTMFFIFSGFSICSSFCARYNALPYTRQMFFPYVRI